MLESQLKEKIVTIIRDINPEVFVIEIGLTQGRKSQLSIKVDTDKGISLAECASISRKVGRWLEEENVFDFPYLLEVSSPGIGAPLRMHRQYLKNIGRNLRVMLLDSTQKEGKLISVTEERIALLPIETKGKKKSKQKKKLTEIPSESEFQISFSEIKESKVIVSI